MEHPNGQNTSFADHVWLHGNIYTEDPENPRAEALASRGQELVFVGTNEDAAAFIGPETAVHDLEGKTVVPGFIEGHMHLQSYGESLLTLPIRDRSKNEILAAVKEAAETTPAGQWILGGMGWNNEVWEDPSYPTKEELDAVSPNHPVMLPRMDGHMIWVNSMALSLCGITEKTPDPEGGEFFRRADGTLTGCAANAASEAIKRHIPPRIRKSGSVRS